MKLTPLSIVRLYWTITVVLLVASVLMAALYAPVDAVMGPVQKILYLHLPAAINMFAGCAIIFVASTGYLWQRRAEWDIVAHAAAQVTVIVTSLVLLTELIWARNEWGVWWSWTPRLSFSLILWVVYAVYLVLRHLVRAAPQRALVSAVYAIVAFINVPLFYLSIKLLDDIHPSESRLQPAMTQTLVLCFVPVTMLCAGLTYARFHARRKGLEHGIVDADPRVPTHSTPAHR